MNKCRLIHFLSAAITILVFFLLTGFNAHVPLKKSAKLTIHFVSIANNKKLVKDSSNVNAFGETYSIHKLKYYISHIQLNDFKEKDSYHLIDAFETDSFTITLPAGNYANLKFSLGVDSLKNCSGAQSGALDPLNDMFWTWNSGYVMFKLEGKSSSSIADLNRIEQHIGGYKGKYKTMRWVSLPITSPLIISENKINRLTIEMNLDKYWQGVNDIKISALPVLTIPGEAAKKAADNFPGMFSVKPLLPHKN